MITILDASLQPALATLLERLVGYPTAIFNVFGHPVQWMGRFITYLDDTLNTTPDVKSLSRLNGMLALLLLLLVVWGIASVLDLVCQVIPYGFILNALLATTLIAQKSMRDHVRHVGRALSSSLSEGRLAVSHIVGRDTSQLDGSGVVKATLESLAENTADGIVAPIFWYVVGGFPALVVYKAINTADSMIGHKTFQHLHFGWAAARLDDLVNLPASRLTALLFAGGALVMKGKAAATSAVRLAWRDAGKHRSPNAGWPEAAMAGALGFKFGGPRAYGGELVDLPTMGEGREHFLRSDIDTALRLYDHSLWLLFALTLVAAVIL